ncbi:MAG: formimidoylglutamase, partial [Balneolaceae bacterium]
MNELNTDLRLRDFIQQRDMSQSAMVHLIAFPSDQGVLINNGRPGSAHAPELIRARLFNLTPHPAYTQKHTKLLRKVVDSGSIPCSEDLDSDQNLLGSTLAERLMKKIIPVVMGGGHETAYGHFLGYVHAGKPVTIVNIDAHTDVRPLKNGRSHSGSPFRQAIEHPSGLCIGYHVFGLNPSTVAADHDQFVREHGSVHYESDTTLESIINCFRSAGESVMVTMDMDAVCQSEAPGVSAPNASGLSSKFWLNLAFELGKQPNVTSFDLCEVNPTYDVDGQTIRLA